MNTREQFLARRISNLEDQNYQLLSRLDLAITLCDRALHNAAAFAWDVGALGLEGAVLAFEKARDGL